MSVFNQMFPMFVKAAQNAGARERLGFHSRITNEATATNELMRRRNEFAKQLEIQEEQRAIDNQRADEQMQMQKDQLAMQGMNTAMDNQRANEQLTFQKEQAEAQATQQAAEEARQQEEHAIRLEAEKRAKEDQEMQKAEEERKIKGQPAAEELVKLNLEKERNTARIMALEEASEKAMMAAYAESGGALDAVTLAKIRAETTGLYKDMQNYVKLRAELKTEADETAYNRWKDSVGMMYRDHAAKIDEANYKFRVESWKAANADSIKGDDAKLWDAAWDKAHQDYMAAYRNGDVLKLPTEDPDKKLEAMAKRYFDDFKKKQNTRDVAPPPPAPPRPPVPPPPPIAMGQPGGLTLPATFRIG